METHRLFIILAGVGVAVRLLFLLLAGDLEPHADESTYIYLALLKNHFGIYTDCALWLWPPAYSHYLAAMFQWFGESAIFAAKFGQVLLSAVVGISIMVLAKRWFTDTVAIVAGVIWSIYLPMIAFTHYLWPETLFLVLFLPGLALLASWLDRPVTERPQTARLAVAGALLAAALLFKEVVFYLLPVFAVLVFLAGRRRGGLAPAIRHSSLFLLAAACVLTPWTIRNYEVYGRFVPGGSTLGKNVQMGLKGAYRNLDYPKEVRKRILDANPAVIDALIGPDVPTAPISRERNVIDLSNENAALALRSLTNQVGYAVKSRIKNLADVVSPTNFFVRHYALDRYHGVLNNSWIRKTLIVTSIILTLCVIGTAFPGAVRANQGTPSVAILWILLAYLFVSTLPITAMSRYRLAYEPMMIIAAAGFLASAADAVRENRLARWFAWGASGAVFVLWLVNAREVIELVRAIG